MGTRHITAVFLDGEYRVAQYGQWDGYPEGAGATILEFLKKWDRTKFIEKLRKCTLMTKDQLDTLAKEIKAKGQGESWTRIYPHLSRDAGADVLQLIQDSKDGLKLKNELDFVADSLMCEFAYVLDLDANRLEFYCGFNNDPLTKDDRFHALKLPEDVMMVDGKPKYYQVKLVASYDLTKKLPTVKALEKAQPKR